MKHIWPLFKMLNKWSGRLISSGCREPADHRFKLHFNVGFKRLMRKISVFKLWATLEGRTEGWREGWKEEDLSEVIRRGDEKSEQHKQELQENKREVKKGLKLSFSSWAEERRRQNKRKFRQIDQDYKITQNGNAGRDRKRKLGIEESQEQKCERS